MEAELQDTVATPDAESVVTTDTGAFVTSDVEPVAEELTENEIRLNSIIEQGKEERTLKSMGTSDDYLVYVTGVIEEAHYIHPTNEVMFDAMTMIVVSTLNYVKCDDGVAENHSAVNYLNDQKKSMLINYLQSYATCHFIRYHEAFNDYWVFMLETMMKLKPKNLFLIYNVASLLYDALTKRLGADNDNSGVIIAVLEYVSTANYYSVGGLDMAISELTFRTMQEVNKLLSSYDCSIRPNKKAFSLYGVEYKHNVSALCELYHAIGTKTSMYDRLLAKYIDDIFESILKQDGNSVMDKWVKDCDFRERLSQLESASKIKIGDSCDAADAADDADVSDDADDVDSESCDDPVVDKDVPDSIVCDDSDPNAVD